MIPQIFCLFDVFPVPRIAFPALFLMRALQNTLLIALMRMTDESAELDRGVVLCRQ
jgi:hypothetical protein